MLVHRPMVDEICESLPTVVNKLFSFAKISAFLLE